MGPSGAGKTTIAHERYYGIPVVSTDKIRQNLFGLGPDGKISAEAYKPNGFGSTFTAAENIVKAYLMAGQDVVYDATNLSFEDRRNFLIRMGFFGDGFSKTSMSVVYCVVDRPLSEKLESFQKGEKWLGVVPHTNPDIIRRHHDKMQSAVDEILNADGMSDRIEVVDTRKLPI